MSRHLGLDLGGTNIKWVVVERLADADGATWTKLADDQVPTLADGGPDNVIQRLAAVGRTAMVEWPDVESVGIGVPGLYDPRTGNTRMLPNLPGDWDGRPMAAVVGKALQRPTFLINDARAFGLAELRLGAGRGVKTMVGITLGTGIGGVIAIDGRVHQGHDGTAGEVGHITIDPNGPDCTCGSNGCLEAFARADRMEELAGAPTAEEAVDRARAGDERALAALATVGRYLGIGIATMINLVTPDRVVIGGGVAAALDLLRPAIHAELERRVTTTDLAQVDLVAAQLGTWAGGIGAAVHGAEMDGA
ncbi:MAG TPA: ROK family protein [Candidatus Limnocylindrales bacterium]|nr:ROK family protein [Candidatus Limnocylindrales bacterium]